MLGLLQLWCYSPTFPSSTTVQQQAMDILEHGLSLAPCRSFPQYLQEECSLLLDRMMKRVSKSATKKRKSLRYFRKLSNGPLYGRLLDVIWNSRVKGRSSFSSIAWLIRKIENRIGNIRMLARFLTQILAYEQSQSQQRKRKRSDGERR